MRHENPSMRPQDIVVLLKIISYGDQPWYQIPMAEELGLSQSEISHSITRSKYAELLDSSGKQVRRLALLEFLQYGLPYVFPQRPGAITPGVPTAHSAEPLNKIIQSSENYVWPAGRGTMRGQSITPLYPGAVEAARNDSKLHELLALVDALRVGRAREKEIAVKELRKRILDGE